MCLCGYVEWITNGGQIVVSELWCGGTAVNTTSIIRVVCLRYAKNDKFESQKNDLSTTRTFHSFEKNNKMAAAAGADPKAAPPKLSKDEIELRIFEKKYEFSLDRTKYANIIPKIVHLFKTGEQDSDEVESNPQYINIVGLYTSEIAKLYGQSIPFYEKALHLGEMEAASNIG